MYAFLLILVWEYIRASSNRTCIQFRSRVPATNRRQIERNSDDPTRSLVDSGFIRLGRRFSRRRVTIAIDVILSRSLSVSS